MTTAVRQIIFLFSILWLAHHAVAADWKPVPGHLMTRWAKDVSPDNVLPEYPRPQMVRAEWRNLNGLWEYSIADLDAARPAEFTGRILVPFCIESALSGVKLPLSAKQRLWYRRTFAAPDLAGGKRLLLHFGAVDWEAKVSVNGKPVGEHKGGYDGFTCDITAVVKPGANNDKGVTRILLNGKFVFQVGFLDQGYWPDGIYTAPTDDALRYDIEMTRKLGMNLARKHVKIEPDRWYYWCDKLGLLVWQDMPHSGPGSGAAGQGAGRNKQTGKVVDGKPLSPEAAAQFESELKAMVEGRRNHPSIIMQPGGTDQTIRRIAATRLRVEGQRRPQCAGLHANHRCRDGMQRSHDL